MKSNKNYGWLTATAICIIFACESPSRVNAAMAYPSLDRSSIGTVGVYHDIPIIVDPPIITKDPKPQHPKK